MPLTDVGFYDAKTLQKLLGVGGQVLQYKGAYDTASPDATAGISALANTARSSAIGLGLDPGVVNEYFGPGVTKAQAQKNMTYLTGLVSAEQSRGKTGTTPGTPVSITPGSVVSGATTTWSKAKPATVPTGTWADNAKLTLTPAEDIPVTPKPDPLMQSLLDMMKKNAQGTSGEFTVPPVDLGALRTEAQGQVKIETDPQLLALRQQQENLTRIFDQKIRDLEPKFNLYTASVTAAAARQRVGAKERLNTRGLYFTSLLDDVIGDIDASELSSIGAAAADKTSLIKNMAEDLAGASQHLGQQRAQIESMTGLKENLIFATLKREAEAAARQGALDQFNARTRAAELNLQSVGQNMSALMTLITNEQNAYQAGLNREFQGLQNQLDRDLETWKFREQLSAAEQEALRKRMDATEQRIADINAATTAHNRDKEILGIKLEGEKELEAIRSAAKVENKDDFLDLMGARIKLMGLKSDPLQRKNLAEIDKQIDIIDQHMTRVRPAAANATGGPTPEDIREWIAEQRAAGKADAEIASYLSEHGLDPAAYGFHWVTR
jgi:hypothetical protein